MYDALGCVYDQPDHEILVTGFFREVAPVVHALRDRRVLDLGCGTGFLSVKLLQAGCSVVGVDVSARMIESARRRCRKFGAAARFKKMAICGLDLGERFSAAFASGDVINHFLSERELRRSLRAVLRQLASGGVIAFDSLNRRAFSTYWNEKTYFFEAPAGDIVMECQWDPAKQVGTADLTTYKRRRGDTYERHKSVIHEKYFAPQLIHSTLRDVGFLRIERRLWSPWAGQKADGFQDRSLWTAYKLN